MNVEATLCQVLQASCKVLLDGLLSALSHLGGLRILHRDVKDLGLIGSVDVS